MCSLGMGLHLRVMRVEVRGEPEGATGGAVGTVRAQNTHHNYHKQVDMHSNHIHTYMSYKMFKALPNTFIIM